MRPSWSYELLRMLTVLAVPLALALIFPYRAIGFHVREPAPASGTVVAFVELDAEGERKAIKTAKASLRSETSRVRRLLADLSFGELPKEPVRPVLSRPLARPAPEPPTLQFGIPVYSPSAAAPAPIAIPAVEPPPPTAAFSRDEMLKIE